MLGSKHSFHQLQFAADLIPTVNDLVDKVSAGLAKKSPGGEPDSEQRLSATRLRIRNLKMAMSAMNLLFLPTWEERQLLKKSQSDPQTALPPLLRSRSAARAPGFTELRTKSWLAVQVA